MREIAKKIREKVRETAAENVTFDRKRRREILKQCHAAADKVTKALTKGGGRNGKKDRKDIRPLLGQRMG